MSTSACGASANARSSASSTPAEDAAGAESSSKYSSGPSQSVARVPFTIARHALSENPTPQWGTASARARASPCSTRRSAGGKALSQPVAGRTGARRIAVSAIDARSRGVVENGRGDFDLDVSAGHGHVQGLAQACAPAGDEGERDRISEDAAVIRRGHVADQLHWRLLGRLGRNLRAFLEHGAGGARPQAHELLAIRRLHRRPLEGAPAREKPPLFFP